MHTIVVLSGGLDSTIALWTSIRRSEVITALTIDYGQQNVREIGAAQAVVEHYRRDAARLRLMGQKAPELHHEVIEIMSVDRAMRSPGSSMRTDMDSMPNRNTIFASIAVGIAISRDAELVVLGFHATNGDQQEYRRFIEVSQYHTTATTKTGITIVAPFVDLPKSSVVALGQTLMAPMHLTWSCSTSGIRHCGTCGSCIDRRSAFQIAGVSDPTDYEE